MTNKTNTFPKLTDAQERAWDIIIEWHEQYGQNGSDTFHALSSLVPMHSSGVPVSDATLAALAKKGLLINHGKARPGSMYGYARYAIHPDYIPAVEPATPAPAAAPAQVEPEAKFKVGDKVVVVNQDDYHTGETGEIIEIDGEYYHIEFLRGGSWNAMWYIESEFIIASKPQPVNNAPEAKFKVGDEVYLKDNPQKRIVGTVNPDGTYGLRTMSGGTGWTDYTADQLTPARDASIPFADMNAYERIIMAAAETNARLEARIKELEARLTENAPIADNMTEEYFGLRIARWARWDGYAIARAFVHALTDANFHDEATKITEMFERE